MWITSGKLRRARGGDMLSEQRSLRGAARTVVVIVEATLADAHHARVRALGDQARGGDMRVRICFVRMDADGREHVRVRLGRGADGRPLALARRDVDHRPDTRRPRPREHARLILDEAGIVQMAMAVNEHGGGLVRAARGGRQARLLDT